MTAKGESTRSLILEKSYHLFTKKGFKGVTMKDICDATGLSRGGLYRHFSSTAEILVCLLGNPDDPILAEIQRGVPARQILEEQIESSKRSILEQKDSLGLAIYEFASIAPPHYFEEGTLLEHARWSQLICYGIGTGEFAAVDADKIADLILYAYEGVLMWSHVTPISERTLDHIWDSIRDILYPKESS